MWRRGWRGTGCLRLMVAGERIGGNADDAATAAASDTVGLANNPTM